MTGVTNNMEEKLIKIEITTPEAIAFRQFMQFHKNFTTMMQSGVFDIRNGAAIINFGPNGEISTIIRNDTLFNSHHT